MTKALQTLFFAATLASIVTTPGCDTDVERGEMSVFRSGPAGSGGGFGNSHVIDTSEIPAIDTQNNWLDGVRLRDVKILVDGNETMIDTGSLHVQNGIVRATVDDVDYAGLDFIGSIWRFQTIEGDVSATLTTVETSEDAGLDDNKTYEELRNLDPARLVYAFKFFDDEKMQHVSTCPEDPTVGARLVLFGDIHVNHLNGNITQRDNTVYFGCLTGVVGKTALYGYAPDNPSTTTSLPLDEFNMATRALRADYCADGHSYTDEGNLLTFEDRHGINSHTEGGFNDEALWGPDGVVCLNLSRLTGLPVVDFTCDGEPIPTCGEVASLGTSDFWTKIE